MQYDSPIAFFLGKDADKQTHKRIRDKGFKIVEGTYDVLVYHPLHWTVKSQNSLEESINDRRFLPPHGLLEVGVDFPYSHAIIPESVEAKLLLRYLFGLSEGQTYSDLFKTQNITEAKGTTRRSFLKSMAAAMGTAATANPAKLAGVAKTAMTPAATTITSPGARALSFFVANELGYAWSKAEVYNRWAKMKKHIGVLDPKMRKAEVAKLENALNDTMKSFPEGGIEGLHSDEVLDAFDANMELFDNLSGFGTPAWTDQAAKISDDANREWYKEEFPEDFEKETERNDQQADKATDNHHSTDPGDEDITDTPWSATRMGDRKQWKGEDDFIDEAKGTTRRSFLKSMAAAMGTAATANPAKLAGVAKAAMKPASVAITSPGAKALASTIAGELIYAASKAALYDRFKKSKEIAFKLDPTMKKAEISKLENILADATKDFANGPNGMNYGSMSDTAADALELKSAAFEKLAGHGTGGWDEATRQISSDVDHTWHRAEFPELYKDVPEELRPVEDDEYDDSFQPPDDDNYISNVDPGDEDLISTPWSATRMGDRKQWKGEDDFIDEAKQFRIAIPSVRHLKKAWPNDRKGWTSEIDKVLK